MRQEAVIEAKHLTRSLSSGVLSTLSKNLRGYPFGSVSPYFMSNDGTVYFYVSDIAQHAKNLLEDPRMSLTVYTQAENSDQNQQGRVTLIGDAHKVSDNDQQALLEQYVTFFPEAKGYTEAHDFNMWKMTVKRVRYIGGFGKIFWIEADEWNLMSTPWDREQEIAMIEHMNQDHLDASQAIMTDKFNLDSAQLMMIAVSPEGCTIQHQNKNYYVPFNKVCVEGSDARKALVYLTKTSRRNLSKDIAPE